MQIQDRINAFCSLGDILLGKKSHDQIEHFWDALKSAKNHNPWFTEDFCRFSIESIASNWLNHSALSKWINEYPEFSFNPILPKKVGVVMAGNVPFVGFHDMLCVLITGNRFIGKVSSKDGGIFQALTNLLTNIEPRFSDFISLTEGKIENFEAIIATGSDNSARYFDYYFGKYPNIIRKNRHSVAVLDGYETEKDLENLSRDIFLYFGLGCRNVSKILVPIDYNIENLIKSFESHKNLINHNKYANNYEYHRAIYLLNRIEHFDNGFVLLKPDESIGSPVGVIFYQYYTKTSSVNELLEVSKDSIQCIVSNNPEIKNKIPFGKAQEPMLNDYSDSIDTIKFLASI